jgi:hypothetical protein
MSDFVSHHKLNVRQQHDERLAPAGLVQDRLQVPGPPPQVRGDLRVAAGGLQKQQGLCRELCGAWLINRTDLGDGSCQIP